MAGYAIKGAEEILPKILPKIVEAFEGGARGASSAASKVGGKLSKVANDHPKTVKAGKRVLQGLGAADLAYAGYEQVRSIVKSHEKNAPPYQAQANPTIAADATVGCSTHNTLYKYGCVCGEGYKAIVTNLFDSSVGIPVCTQVEDLTQARAQTENYTCSDDQYISDKCPGGGQEPIYYFPGMALCSETLEGYSAAFTYAPGSEQANTEKWNSDQAEHYGKVRVAEGGAGFTCSYGM